MVFVWAVVGIMKLTYMAVKGTISSGVPLLILMYFFIFYYHFISPISSNISNISIPNFFYESLLRISTGRWPHSVLFLVFWVKVDRVGWSIGGKSVMFGVYY